MPTVTVELTTLLAPALFAYTFLNHLFALGKQSFIYIFLLRKWYKFCAYSFISFFFVPEMQKSSNTFVIFDRFEMNFDNLILYILLQFNWGDNNKVNFVGRFGKHVVSWLPFILIFKERARVTRAINQLANKIIISWLQRWLGKKFC
jgi:hypothetical protein